MSAATGCSCLLHSTVAQRLGSASLGSSRLLLLHSYGVRVLRSCTMRLSTACCFPIHVVHAQTTFVRSAWRRSSR